MKIPNNLHRTLEVWKVELHSFIANRLYIVYGHNEDILLSKCVIKWLNEFMSNRRRWYVIWAQVYWIQGKVEIRINVKLLLSTFSFYYYFFLNPIRTFTVSFYLFLLLDRNIYAFLTAFKAKSLLIPWKKNKQKEGS